MDTREIPASAGQRLLWFLDRYRGQSGALNCPMTCRIKGPLDDAALQAALHQLTARHESLRTTFARQGRRLMQLIHPAGRDLPVSVDLSCYADPGVAMERALAGELQTRIDPTDWPVRATIWRLADDDHVLCLNMHHLVTDTWSCDVLFRELAAIYDGCSGGGSVLPPVGWQYAQFTLWQERRRGTDDFRRQLEYWQHHLDGVEPPRLPVASRQEGGAPQRSAEQFEIAGSVATALRELARRQGTTVFAVTFAVYYVLLYQLTGQRDLAVGSIFANRARAEVQNTVGFLANLLVLRTRLPEAATFAGVLDSVRRTVVDAFAHQELAFHLLPQITTPQGPMRLDDLVFQMLPEPLEVTEQAGKTQFRSLVPDVVGRFDFEFALMPRGDGFAGKLYYTQSRVSAPWARELIGTYDALARAVAAAPDLPIGRLPRAM